MQSNRIVNELFLLCEEAKIHEYASLQVTFPKEIQEEMMKLRQSIPFSSFSSEEDPAEGYEAHVTCFYGLSEGDAISCAELLSRWGVFSVTIHDTIKYFTDNPAYDVCYYPVESLDLEHIHKVLRFYLHKDPPTYKEFRPHMTVGYLKKGMRLPLSPHWHDLVCVVSELDFRLKDEVPLRISLER